MATCPKCGYNPDTVMSHLQVFMNPFINEKGDKCVMNNDKDVVIAPDGTKWYKGETLPPKKETPPPNPTPPVTPPKK